MMNNARAEPDATTLAHRYNPFHKPNPHTLDCFMQYGHDSVERNDFFSSKRIRKKISIKDIRNKVLCYLEPQYRRIVAASTALVEFIKRQQGAGGIFAMEDRMSPVDPHYCHCAAEGLELLKQCATAFHRDAPLWIKAQIRETRPRFARHIGVCQRETLLGQATDDVKSGNFMDFANHFIHAFLEMNQQYTVIQEARKNLFKWDLVAYPGVRRSIDARAFEEEVHWMGEDQESATSFTPTALPVRVCVCDCHFTVN